MKVAPRYKDIINYVDEDTFFDFFHDIGADPQWCQCGGKEAIKLLTICHHGTHHNAVFDPETHKVTCFSDCGDTVKLHTWICRVLDTGNPNEGREFFTDWLNGQNIDFDIGFTASRASHSEGNSKLFDPFQRIDMVQGIEPNIIADLYSHFDTSVETLSRLSWHTKDGIPVEQLAAFQVAYNPENRTIILPHHNVNGEIVGLYERTFDLLRDDVKQMFIEWEQDIYTPFISRQIYAVPKSKYMPLLKSEKYRTKAKPCWSFPNAQNLYGLHRAKEAIAEKGMAIVFEGAKSVMLAHAYGYPYAVATHTFGASLGQLALLAQAGAAEIILAFDRQYQSAEGTEWDKYEKRTKGLAERVDMLNVSRIVDTGNLLRYKDAPIDRGREVFQQLFENREVLKKMW